MGKVPVNLSLPYFFLAQLRRSQRFLCNSKLPINKYGFITQVHTKMKRISAQASHLRKSYVNSIARRWTSYDKSTLTEEALAAQVQAGLGDDVKLNLETRTIDTTELSLPISPLFEPKWIKPRKRETKVAAHPQGRFRRKIFNNPYGTIQYTRVKT